MLFVLRDGREVFAFDGSINRITSGGLNVWGQLAYDSVSIYIHSLSPKKLNNRVGVLKIANEQNSAVAARRCNTRRSAE
jgi:hypothetical protein